MYHRGSRSYSPLSKERDKEDPKSGPSGPPGPSGSSGTAKSHIPTSFPQPFEEPDNQKLEKYQYQYQYPFPSIDPPTPRTSIDRSRERDDRSARPSLDRSVLTPSPKQETPRSLHSKILPSVSELDKSIKDKRKLSDVDVEERKRRV